MQIINWASLVAQMVKNLPAMQETWVWSLGQEDPLEKGMATHSRINAWRIPWTEEPDRLQFMGSQRVGHTWVTDTSTSIVNGLLRASLVAHWQRVCLSLQDTWVWLLAQEDPVWQSATKPISHNYGACALEPGSCNEKLPRWEACTAHLEKKALLATKTERSSPPPEN